ncbi:MAG: GIY-YIG nuclease family protein [Candidatus Omnitrophica bacterium]|nr:GIY-YIG nuclease family protein [Candidatus Omnitrophota bacterium]
MSSKKITVFLVEGLPKGVREIKIDQWSGLGLCIPRNRLNATLQNSEHLDLQDKDCVYFLIGETEEGSLNKVYIGQAGGFKQRIKQQEGQKDWWKDVVVFLSKDGSLTSTGSEYLESVCIERLKKAGKCVLDNNVQPREKTIPREDVSGLELFYDNIALIMPLMGFDIFIPKESLLTEDVTQILFCKGKGVIARGILLNDGKLKVLKGSEAVFKDVESFKNHFYRGLKEELLEMKRLRQEKDKLLFVDDYVFDSPSAAAAIVLARSASGPVEWKREDGKSLKKILETE